MDSILSKFSLEGKVALVTGAAYGIGFAIAEAYANAGAKIAFNCRSQKHMDQALADYKAKGIDAKGYICDVTDEEEVKAMVADIEKELGVIDILVNNAGIIKRIPMTEMSVEEFRQVVDIDLNAPFIVSKAVIPGMIKKGHGKIINVCSMMSELGRETVSAYAAAKGGLKMLTRNICSEFGEHNIQCNGIGPGYMATPQTAPLRERQADGSRHPFDSFIVSKTPAARWGTPEDLMGPAIFLASDASDFVNGHILYVDGGILARQIHATAAYWLFALAALHMGIHLPKRIFCPSTPTAKFLLSIIILAIYALGIYAWEERSMGEKLFSGYTFDFWNDSVPAIYFFAYNLSIFLCLAISAAIADKSFNKILNNSAKNHNDKP